MSVFLESSGSSSHTNVDKSCVHRYDPNSFFVKMEGARRTIRWWSFVGVLVVDESLAALER